MTLPDPVPGLVIRYGFLWSHESARGQVEGTKDRPCAIIVAAKREPHGAVKVTLAPITHTPPTDHDTCLALSAATCKVLGLDGHKQWLRFDELNTFDWPGFDLRAIPASNSYAYGMLPKAEFDKLKASILKRIRQGHAPVPVNRNSDT